MRPIDADYLKSKVHMVGNESGRVYWFDVEDAPTLDVKPIVHAHWIEHRTSSGNVHNVCSCCGKEVSYPYAKKRWKYCIECGAKMDEEKESNHE